MRRCPDQTAAEPEQRDLETGEKKRSQRNLLDKSARLDCGEPELSAVPRRRRQVPPSSDESHALYSEFVTDRGVGVGSGEVGMDDFDQFLGGISPLRVGVAVDRR